MYPVHASGCFSVCDRLAGIFPDKGESTATVCADMDQKASGIHHLRAVSYTHLTLPTKMFSTVISW